jgi:beta-lactamase regulating signal transducer with metallopeptidase domain
MDPASSGFLIWASVAALLCGRVVTRLGRLRGLERRLQMSADPALQSVVADFCRRSRRHVLLLEGDSNEPPMTWGHTRPVLLLPAKAREWPAERLQSVLLHELAHVERGDWLISVASEVICCLFWFNPFVWVLRSRMELESEAAADDRVLSMGVSAPQYATHLVELLRDLHKYPKSADAALAMARPGRLDGRVQAILEERRSRRTARGSAALGSIASVMGVVLVTAAAAPTIVRQSAPAITSKIENAVASTSFPPPTVEETPEAPSIDERTDRASKPNPAEPTSLHAKQAQPKAPKAPLNAPAATPATNPASGSAGSISIGDDGAKGMKALASLSKGGAVLQNGGSTLSVGDDVNIDLSNIEVKAELQQAQNEVRKAFKDAEAEMKGSGLSIDFSGVTAAALSAAAAQIKSAPKIGKIDVEAITQKALETAQKSMRAANQTSHKAIH